MFSQKFKPTHLLLLLASMLSIFQSNATENYQLQQSRLIGEKLVLAMNSGQYDVLKTFTQNQISELTLQRFGLQMYSNYLAAESHFHGKFDIQEVTLSSTSSESISSILHVHSRNTLMDYQIELTITSAKPHKIERIRLRAQTQKRSVYNNLNQSQAVSALSTYIDYLDEKGVFSGAVLIAKNNTVLLEKAVGLASKRFNIKNKIDTRFNLGSMNKMFTSIAILQLAEAGKLKLEDTLVEVLDIDSGNMLLNQIQIQHLLSHTSGIGGVACKKGDAKISMDKPACLQKLISAQVHFKPGTQYQYSNDGMYVLGLVLESVTGMDYYTIIKKRVYDKAGMSDTESLDLQFPVTNAAIGYAYYGMYDNWRNNLFIHDKKGGPAGGGYSTVRDLFKFATALKSHTMLSKQMTQTALTPKIEFGASNYGFGFIDWKHDGKPVVGHNGSFVGVSSQMEMHLDSGYTIIVLSNHSFGADPVITRARQLFPL